MRTNVVLPVWVPPPEVRPAAGLKCLDINSIQWLHYKDGLLRPVSTT